MLKLVHRKISIDNIKRKTLFNIFCPIVNQKDLSKKD